MNKRRKWLLFVATAVFSLTGNSGTSDACFLHRRVKCVQPPALTPEVARQALLQMLRSEPGKPLEAFTPDIVDKMAKLPVELHAGKAQWTGACHFNLNKRSYWILIPWGKGLRELIQPNYTGGYVFVDVFEGTIVQIDGRWVATLPKHQSSLLD